MNTRRPLQFRLKELREKNNCSIEELAQIFNVTQGQIVSWENCECDPPVRQVIQMARYFNCTTDYLLGLQNDRAEVEKIFFADDYKKDCNEQEVKKREKFRYGLGLSLLL